MTGARLMQAARRRAFAALTAAAAAAAAGTLSASHEPRSPARPTTARRTAIVLGRVPRAASADAASASARRFAMLYARAYGHPLSGRDRRALGASAAPAVARLLVDQPPERPLAGGELVALTARRVSATAFGSRALLAFARRRVTLVEIVELVPGAGWRVTTFEPLSGG